MKKRWGFPWGNKLTNEGRIPKGINCPFKRNCLGSMEKCKHTGKNHPCEFSCAIARSFNMMTLVDVPEDGYNEPPLNKVLKPNPTPIPPAGKQIPGDNWIIKVILENELLVKNNQALKEALKHLIILHQNYCTCPGCKLKQAGLL